ncbi:S8 family peptidase [Winogradskyella eckloniae]|uniref:S8 family peptidase n=1 Tax=Winogradskyella eckloniae TaxID=1089306 RepID=UPI0015635953|nr:S8 family peptidase [Winogradskyella eckloniae]NRD20062.1 S8 family peptidase [Winogradskyella eckloniae]
MAKKNLPVKLFQKRQKIDDRRVEGGGSKTIPKWQLDGEELQKRANSLLEPLSELDTFFENRNKTRSFIPATLRVDIDDNAIAKSHRQDIQKLFNGQFSKNNIIGFIDSNIAIVKVDSIEDSKVIKKKINNYHRNPKAISAVETIEIFEPFIADIEENKKNETVKISLIDFLNYEINNAVKISFEKYCKQKSIDVVEANYSSGLIIYKIKNATKAQLDSISDFEALESITFMPKYSVGMDLLNSGQDIEVKEPIKDEEYPIIGVLDSGIAKNQYLSPWLLDRNFSSYPEDLVNPTHGSCVSSIIIYGDDLEGENWTGNSGCKLFDATVFPDETKESIDEDELIANIREAIKKNSDIKIWNLSLGTKSEADLNDFSDFGKALDDIQISNEVIICKSTGNCRNFERGFPKSRIARSGDSIRSLVVGSIAHSKNENDIADVNHPSPFTRIGPGPANSIKPDLVSYGGNAGMNGGRRVENGVKAIAPDGSPVKIIGTSFSTPRVTSLLSELNFKVREKFNPTLLKALAIHSAKYPLGVNFPINEKVNQMGFGIASSADEIIYNDPHEITLILQENINKGEFIEILDFPFPESLIDDEGHFYGEVKVTLVAQPVLREKQGAEYCQSNLDLMFGTYENIKDRDTTKSNILNPFGPDDTQNVLLDSNYKSAYIKDTESDYARERVLLNYGKKYQPVKKYSVNLSEMKDARQRDSLASNRKWYAKIKGTYRDFAETRSKEDGEVLNQDFTLIVTIRDTKEQHQVYNEVSRLLADRNFLHSNIKLREEIRIDVQGKNN